MPYRLLPFPALQAKKRSDIHIKILDDNPKYTPLFIITPNWNWYYAFIHTLFTPPIQRLLMYPILRRHTTVPKHSCPHWISVVREPEHLCSGPLLLGAQH